MARLLINPGSSAAWEIHLRPGANLLGRGFANDFKIEDPSVSGSHCEILLNGHSAVIKDLGSTNGTYINRAPVKEASLEPGHIIHLGGVEMVFQADAPAHASVSETEVLPLPAARPSVARISGLPPASLAGRAVPPPIAESAAPPSPPPAVTGGQNCKFHPKTIGRYLCSKCQLFFCELCVTSRAVGNVPHKFCRRCGTECVPVQVQLRRGSGQKGFVARLPGVFIYPFKGSGVFVLIVCTIIISALSFVSMGWLSILSKIVFFGYLFSFMQNIIHSTAAEDEEIPGWPPFDAIFGGFFGLVGCVLMSFGPAIGLAAFAIFGHEPMAAIAMIPAMVFGCLYCPMALLAVAMKDSPLAANPLVVVPAIFKVPLEYLLTVVLLGSVVGLNVLGGSLIPAMFPRGLTTHSMPMLFAFLGTYAFWFFAEVCLLTISMRILGLLYVTKKQRFGWFSH